ncbi:MAG: hypothetical protein GF320_03570 [Armatimonadia bacterium]|nr:hypothetical protein [Armatimonadia bacterium]
MSETDERKFRSAVEDLKQRGGRTLSLVDLIDAGTLSLDSAAYLAARIQEGASYFTGAVPGGAGKTTILAALLAAVPPGEPIVTVSGESVLDRTHDGRVTWLVHEVQNAMYYAYLWGPAVSEFFDKASRGDRIVSCMHADDLPQMARILGSPPNGVTPDQLLELDLILFLRMTGGRGGTLRRVSSVLESDGREHREIFRWDPGPDEHVAVGQGRADAERVARCRGALEGLIATGERDWSAVREGLSDPGG